jgi:hypothetical protein
MSEPDNVDYEIDECDVDSQLSFLGELGNDVYVPKPTKVAMDKEAKLRVKEAKMQQLEQDRADKRHAKEVKRFEAQQLKESKRRPKQTDEDADSLFGGEPTQIQGKDKILLLRKAKQYKTLFPTELKTFKLKKDPSVKDLADAISEMEVIIETGGVNEFLEDSVIQCIKLVENVSAISPRYDVRGMALMLQHNAQFKKLSKILFVKYNVFSVVPPEFQMIMLIGTTAMIANSKNRGKEQMNAYLDSPV